MKLLWQGCLIGGLFSLAGCGTQGYQVNLDIGVPVQDQFSQSPISLETFLSPEKITDTPLSALVSGLASDECIQDQLIFAVDEDPSVDGDPLKTQRIHAISKIVPVSHMNDNCGYFRFITSDNDLATATDMPNLIPCLIGNGNLRLTKPITATLTKSGEIGMGVGGYLVKPIGRDNEGRCLKFTPNKVGTIAQRTLEQDMAGYPSLASSAIVPVETFSVLGHKRIFASEQLQNHQLKIFIYPAQLKNPTNKTISGTQTNENDTTSCARYGDDNAQNCPAANFKKIVWNPVIYTCDTTSGSKTCTETTRAFTCPLGTTSCDSLQQMDSTISTNRPPFTVESFPDSTGKFLIKQNFLSVGLTASFSLVDTFYAVVPDLPGQIRVSYLINLSTTVVPEGCVQNGDFQGNCRTDTYDMRRPNKAFFEELKRDDRRFFLQTFGSLQNHTGL